MASEAQRIMNLSLTKIVSSRGRRGGVSLHRNLLVASVLFKARDVYAAEVAGLVVIRDGFVYDRNAPSSSADHDHEAAEVPDQCSETDDDNIIPDQRIQDTVNAVVVVDPVPVHHDSLSCDETVDSDLDADREKENIKPMDSKPVKRSLRSSKVQCRKRKYTEVEQAVLSITEKSNNIATKKAHVEDDNSSSLNCSEFSSTLPQWSANQTSDAGPNLDSFHSVNNQSSDSFHDTYSDHSYNDYDGDIDDDESMYHDDDVKSFQPSCHVVDSCNSAASDSISRSLSHSVLVVSV